MQQCNDTLKFERVCVQISIRLYTIHKFNPSYVIVMKLIVSDEE